MNRIDELYSMHEEYNNLHFAGKLRTITMLVNKNRTKDGFYCYKAHKDWRPIRDQLWKSSITISVNCWDEGTVEATMLHEMIHQYQCEVLDRAPHHDIIFTSMAIKLEEEYGFAVQ